MARGPTSLAVYLESGRKRVFAGVLEWPGWCRSGRTEGDALAALASYAARYAAALADSGLTPLAPVPMASLTVRERLVGDATTDFGAPSIAPSADARPLDDSELARQQRVLDACWDALERASVDAADVELTRGPRGGGRDLNAIVGHVVRAEAYYVRRLAAPAPAVDESDLGAAAMHMRAAERDALVRAVTEGLPERGPRGGSIWSPRYFVRRAAWHVLDHTWEIEDRAR